MTKIPIKVRISIVSPFVLMRFLFVMIKQIKGQNDKGIKRRLALNFTKTAKLSILENVPLGTALVRRIKND